MIFPRTTRRRICRALNMLRNKRVENRGRSTTTFRCEAETFLRGEGAEHDKLAASATRPLNDYKRANIRIIQSIEKRSAC